MTVREKQRDEGWTVTDYKLPISSNKSKDIFSKNVNMQRNATIEKVRDLFKKITRIIGKLNIYVKNT